ncbi:MAG: hypothetical protein WDZ37_05530 [Solirubrobacterales bacterium]
MSLDAGSPASGGLTSPLDGVAVKWRLKLGDLSNVTSASAKLRVIRGNRGVSSSQVQTLVSNGTHQFDTRQPVKIGDRFGIDTTLSSPFIGISLQIMHSASPSPSMNPYHYWTPPLADDESRSPTATYGGELLLNADIEPDADGDGFGDETQDQCPASASSQSPCPPAPPLSGPAVSDRAAPAGLASFARTLKLRSALRRGLNGKVSSNEPADISGSAEVAARLGRRFGLKSARPVVVARGRASLAAAGVANLRLSFTKKARRKLRRARKVGLTLRINLTDKASNTAKFTRKATLRR